jgi:methionyl aminopeptidase
LIQYKTSQEIEILKECNQLVAEVLATLESRCQPGVSTLDLDRIAEELTYKHKARPAFKGYHGFPATLCTSINEEVVHGIPSSKRILKAGDIISIDYGVCYKGFYGDAAITVAIGEVSQELVQLLQITRESLMLGIQQATPGNHLGDISTAIQFHAESHGYSVVKEYSGHGVGKSLHEEPAVLNYASNGRGIQLKPGLVIAIEPMVNLGSDKVQVQSDGWTVVTRDRQPSAHFEHSIAITDSDPLILSQRKPA